MNRKNVKEIKDKNRKREDKNKVLEEKRWRKKMKIRRNRLEEDVLAEIPNDQSYILKRELLIGVVPDSSATLRATGKPSM